MGVYNYYPIEMITEEREREREREKEINQFQYVIKTTYLYYALWTISDPI